MIVTDNYRIDIEGDSIGITNLKDNTLDFIVLNQALNWANWVWRLIGDGTKHSWSLGTDKTREDGYDAWDIIYITDGSTYFDVWKRKENELTQVIPQESINTCLPFTLVTGCSGGGTSIVVKSLRYFGVYFGADCGDFKMRKTHESVAIRVYLDQFLHEGGLDEDSKFLQTVLSIYRRDEDKINAFKLTDLGHNDRLEKILNTFNISKVVSVVKEKNENDIRQSDEGRAFNELNQIEILKHQFLPIEGRPVFHINWKKYFTDYNYVNKVLRFLGVDLQINQAKFYQMLEAINFDQKKL